MYILAKNLMIAWTLICGTFVFNFIKNLLPTNEVNIMNNFDLSILGMFSVGTFMTILDIWFKPMVVLGLVALISKPID